MNHGNWVPLRKTLIKYLPKDRSYTKLEAMFSLSIDYDSGRRVSYSGYAKLWQWSRNKVRKFLGDSGLSIIGDKLSLSDLHRIETGVASTFVDPRSQIIDSKKGHPERQVKDTYDSEKGHDKLSDDSNSGDHEDSIENEKGQVRDTLKDTTIYPNNPNPTNNNPQKFRKSDEEEFYLTKKKRKLKGKRLETFKIFWEKFGLKLDKANAADAWLDIEMLNNKIVAEIYNAAENECANRAKKTGNSSPIYAQGWITGRRWEDELGGGTDVIDADARAKNKIDETMRYLK